MKYRITKLSITVILSLSLFFSATNVTSAIGLIPVGGRLVSPPTPCATGLLFNLLSPNGKTLTVMFLASSAPHLDSSVPITGATILGLAIPFVCITTTVPPVTIPALFVFKYGIAAP